MIDRLIKFNISCDRDGGFVDREEIVCVFKNYICNYLTVMLRNNPTPIQMYFEFEKERNEMFDKLLAFVVNRW